MKPLLISFLMLFSSILTAPPNKVISIAIREGENPYERIIKAVVAVESGGDTLAYNPKEDAAGAFQIRQIRLDAYNMETGNSYKPKDRFNYGISRSIFLHYAIRYNPGDVLSICRDWNGASEHNKYYSKIIAVL